MGSKETIETVDAVNPMTRGEAAERSTGMGDQMTAVQTKQPMFETTWRAKWLADGAKTIEEMAETLESEAARLRELAAAGVELADDVEDDYASLTTVDPEVAAKYEFEPVEEEDDEEGGSQEPGYDTKLMQKASYAPPEVPHEVTDIARLRVATERLRADGYVVMDGGCCRSCNWGHINAQYPDAVNVVQFNDQCLESAFGEIEPTPEWRGYLDGAGDNEDESERRFEAWLDHWGDDEHSAAQRPGMLSHSLWIQHDGDAARAVEIIRGSGLDAVWDSDSDKAIEVRPRAGGDGVIRHRAVDLAGEAAAGAVSHEAASSGS